MLMVLWDLPFLIYTARYHVFRPRRRCVDHVTPRDQYWSAVQPYLVIWFMFGKWWRFEGFWMIVNCLELFRGLGLCGFYAVFFPRAYSALSLSCIILYPRLPTRTLLPRCDYWYGLAIVILGVSRVVLWFGVLFYVRSSCLRMCSYWSIQVYFNYYNWGTYFWQWSIRSQWVGVILKIDTGSLNLSPVLSKLSKTTTKVLKKICKCSNRKQTHPHRIESMFLRAEAPRYLSAKLNPCHINHLTHHFYSLHLPLPQLLPILYLSK